MALPLEGIRVLDIGTMTAGPYASRFLADLGAEVIKVEPPNGEVSRNLGLKFGENGYLFHVNNYNKKSITAKVQEEEGRNLFLKLVSESDVVIENFSRGTMEKWGLGFEDCRKVNPYIIYCSITGFGQEGILKNKRAYDTVVQALSGIMHTTGNSDLQPLKGGPSIVDLFAATVTSTSIVIALWNRDKDNSAQQIDVSLMNGGIWSLLSLWPYIFQREGNSIKRIGNEHWEHFPYGDYQCQDGSIFLTVKNNEHWKSLAKILNLSEEWNINDRNNYKELIEEKLEEFLADQEIWEASTMLQKLGIPAAPILDLEKVVSLDHVKFRKNIINIQHNVYGDIPLVNSPLDIGKGISEKIRTLPPTLGEHNEEIYKMLGSTDVKRNKI